MACSEMSFAISHRWAGVLSMFATGTGFQGSKATCGAVKRISSLSAQGTWVVQMVCLRCSGRVAIRSSNSKVSARAIPFGGSATTLMIAVPREVFAFVNCRTLFFVRR